MASGKCKDKAFQSGSKLTFFGSTLCQVQNIADLDRLCFSLTEYSVISMPVDKNYLSMANLNKQ